MQKYGTFSLHQGGSFLFVSKHQGRVGMGNRAFKRYLLVCLNIAMRRYFQYTQANGLKNVIFLLYKLNDKNRTRC